MFIGMWKTECKTTISFWGLGFLQKWKIAVPLGDDVGVLGFGFSVGVHSNW